MIIFLYSILLVYFFLGGIITYFINKDNDPQTSKKYWLKYIVYLLIVNLLFISILINTSIFLILSILILLMGYYEIISSILRTNNFRTGIPALLIFSGFAFLYVKFSFLPEKYLFYALYITTVFDAMSQLSGQLFGKKKLLPTVSPNKTYEGLAGGLIFSTFTSFGIRNLLDLGIYEAIGLGILISGFAFSGDLLASYCKRKFMIKDFSNLIPGHGGFLDRFDSLIATG